MKQIATQAERAQRPVKPAWKPALLCLCTGMIAGPFFFGLILFVGHDAAKSTREVSLAIGGMGAILFSVVAVVSGIMALMRCNGHRDALAIVGIMIGLGAIILFWSGMALLFYLSAKYF